MFNAIPSQKCERLMNTCGPQVTDLGTRKLPQEWGEQPRAVTDPVSSVIPYRVQREGLQAGKVKFQTAVGFGAVPEQVLCDFTVKGHIQAKNGKCIKYCSPLKTTRSS